MSTKIITAVSKFYQCEQLYKTILSQTKTKDNVFLLYKWHKIWVESHRKSIKSLIIIIIYDNHRPIALFPLCIREARAWKFPYQSIEFIGAKDANYSNFLIVEGVDKNRVLKEFLEALKNIWRPQWLFFTLPVLPKKLLDDYAFESYMKEDIFTTAPFIKIEGNWQWYFRNYIKKNLREDLKRRINKATKEVGRVSLENASPEGLEQFFDMHIKEWRSRGWKSRYLEPENRGFDKKLLANFGFADFTKLKFGNHIVAYHFGYRYHGHFYYTRPTFDIRFSRLSPGKLLLTELIKRETEQESKIFDLGRGQMKYKYWFGKTEIPLVATRIYKNRLVLLISRIFQRLRKK